MGIYSIIPNCISCVIPRTVPIFAELYLPTLMTPNRGKRWNGEEFDSRKSWLRWLVNISWEKSYLIMICTFWRPASNCRLTLMFCGLGWRVDLITLALISQIYWKPVSLYIAFAFVLAYFMFSIYLSLYSTRHKKEAILSETKPANTKEELRSRNIWSPGHSYFDDEGQLNLRQFSLKRRYRSTRCGIIMTTYNGERIWKIACPIEQFTIKKLIGSACVGDWKDSFESSYCHIFRLHLCTY